MSDGQQWLRVSRRWHCRICGKSDWCLIADDGNAAICARTESPKRCGDAGWLHKLRDSDARQYHPERRAVPAVRPRPPIDFGRLAAKYAARCDHERAAQLAAELGVTELSLHRLGLGFDGEAFTLPMKDVDGRIIGIQRRFRNGGKCSVNGSKSGLFVPTSLSDDGLLLVCEGPTDTAAVLDLGFSVIGRPSCAGGVKLVCELARGRDTVVVADSDGPGQRGAKALASALRLYCPVVRIIRPPDGVKDARSWINQGATRDDVQATIDAAEPLKLGMKTNTTAGHGRRVIREELCQIPTTSY